MTLEEMLNDAKFADDVSFKVGETEYKLGDLRGYKKTVDQQKTEAAAKLGEIEKQRKAFEVEKQRTDKLTEDALNLYESMKTAAKTKPGEGDDYSFEGDPWLGKVGKALTKITTQLAESQKAQEASAAQFKAALADGFKYVLTREYERDWNSIPENERPKDKSWRDYLKVAQEAKIINEWGIPDPKMAWEREYGPSRLEQLKKAEYERGMREAEERARQTQPPRPGVPGASSRPGGKPDKVYSSIDELVNDAFGDADVMNAARGTVQ